MTTQFLDGHFLDGHTLAGHWLDGGQLPGAESQADLDPEESTFYSILIEVKRLIDAIGLDGAPTVRIRKLPTDQGIGIAKATELPVVLLSPYREDVLPEGPIGADDVRYAVIVLTLDADNRDGTLQAGLDQTLLWREEIRRTFDNKRLSAIAGCIRTDVQLLDVMSKEAWAVNYRAGALMLQFTVRELHQRAA